MPQFTKIGEIPQVVKWKLSILINGNEYWKKLAGNMGMSIQQLVFLNSVNNQPPGSALLDEIKHKPVAFLYHHLYALSFQNAMALLDPYVEEDVRNQYSADAASHVKNDNVTSATGAHQSQLEHTKNDVENMNVTQQDSKPCAKMGNIGRETDTIHCQGKSVSSMTACGADVSSDDVSSEKNIPPHIIEECSLDSSLSKFTDISYKDVETATDNWSPSNILGKNGSSSVYRGIFRGKQCAIKRLRPEKGELQIARGSELRTLQSLNHASLLHLFGFCEGSDCPCLIYPLMLNGSLEDHLQHENEMQHLPLSKRIQIAERTTQGLCYLKEHFKKPLVIKSSNILLDSCLMPRIGDICLPSMLPQQTSSTMLAYLPDDFSLSKEPTMHLDTYSMGVVLLELATDQCAYSAEGKFLKREAHSGIFNKRMQKMVGDSDKLMTVLQHLFGIGLMCVPVSGSKNIELSTLHVYLKDIPLISDHVSESAQISSGSHPVSSKFKKSIQKA